MVGDQFSGRQAGSVSWLLGSWELGRGGSGCSVKVSDIREALNQCIRATEVSLALWSGTQGANHSSMGTAENDTITGHLQCAKH